MNECSYNPVYRICRNCGREMQRTEVRQCVPQDRNHPQHEKPDDARVVALREARDLIKSNCVSTWNSGQVERSDGLTDLLAQFDRRFPEVI